jgi:N-acetyl-anhydromuramyl-L-alanine amidase AmpD
MLFIRERPFVQAKYFTPAHRTKIDVVVIHSMENQEKPESAEQVAAWFAGPTSPKASPHYCVDTNSIVGCVREQDVAWHAPGVNHNGIGIEHAGFARQTRADWLDPYSLAMLTLSAQLCAEICVRWSIPVVRLSSNELRGRTPRGICGHKDVSEAFPGKDPSKDHWDPGPGFPWDRYIAMVLRAVEVQRSQRNVTIPNLQTAVGIQIALQTLGFEIGRIDGIIGPKTRQAIIEFQHERSLNTDGVVGPMTRLHLEQALLDFETKIT